MSKILHSTTALKKFLKDENSSGVYLVTSKKLLKKLSREIKEIGIDRRNIILIPDGEAAKEWKELEKLLRKFSGSGIDRRGIVIALGGGSVGDMVGFACSIYLRGVQYIQVPTTLLAQVDSAHGGKTGINFLNYKNQIGSFYRPLAIVLDVRLLKSLSKEQIVDGLGEIIKAGIIKDSSILSLLKKEKVSTLIRSKNLRLLVEKTIRVKQYYVAEDFEDKGIRQILNFGHTVSHAIELKYEISHGRAVIVGMIEELKIAERLGLTPPSIRQNLMRLLKNLGIRVDENLKINWPTILKDKKIAGGKITLPVIEKEGKSRLIKLDLKALKIPAPHFIYILECADGSLYVGCTNNLEKRLREHNGLKSGAHYTKIRRPVKLKYSEKFPNLKDARAREAEIKRWPREKKLGLIGLK